MRSELRRMILAFATRTASALVGRSFGRGVFGSSPSTMLGIAGSNGVGLVEPRSTGCMLIGPVQFGLSLCITDNAVPSNSLLGRGSAACEALSHCAISKRFHRRA
jgi:hypothetical protein